MVCNIHYGMRLLDVHVFIRSVNGRKSTCTLHFRYCSGHPQATLHHILYHHCNKFHSGSHHWTISQAFRSVRPVVSLEFSTRWCSQYLFQANAQHAHQRTRFQLTSNPRLINRRRWPHPTLYIRYQETQNPPWFISIGVHRRSRSERDFHSRRGSYMFFHADFFVMPLLNGARLWFD